MTAGIGIKALAHGDDRVAALVVEVDQFVEFQPGTVRRLLDHLRLEQHTVTDKETTDTRAVVQHGCLTLLGRREALILRLDTLHERERAITVQGTVEGNPGKFEGTSTIGELVS